MCIKDGCIDKELLKIIGNHLEKSGHIIIQLNLPMCIIKNGCIDKELLKIICVIK